MTSWSSTKRNRQVLGVAPRGRPDGGIQDLGLDVQWHGVGPYPPHGPGRVERFFDVHGLLPLWSVGTGSRADGPYNRIAGRVRPGGLRAAEMPARGVRRSEMVRPVPCLIAESPSCGH